MGSKIAESQESQMCMRRGCNPILAAALLPLFAQPALAHAGGRGQVLLLPTQYYISGGALAVLASVILVALLPHRAIRSEGRAVAVFRPLAWAGPAISLASLLLIV